ncbi:hypothetical protein RDI58_004170 [Solanum bulbocastanum]|uniref:DUF4216 domain-containing protein n=1 Tax=Solanum bulbocastanum TaxID=147425 RepID=A0AAN8U0P2_SOLBU
MMMKISTGKTIPESFYKAKKVIKDLGLHYENIHACTNDCMLFWNDTANLDKCSVSGSSRWKNVHDDLTNKVTKIPAKVLMYFPLKPRLQRIFMCSETSVAMRWHDTERPKDGNLRHPADGVAWKDFDSLHPDFASNARNVRLGLPSDGFNPFRTMSISYSTWPVMLMNYNLSPWICMKPEYIMLSMIIPGPRLLEMILMYQTKDDEDNQTKEGDASPLFPKTGHPIGSMNKRKGKTFNMEHHEWFEAHRYALFNTRDEKVETFIKEHKNLIDNRTRGNAWVKAQIHSREFSDWFRDKVKNIEVSNHLRWLAKGPNFVAKRYTGYFINGYRFHTKTWDVPCKTQNSGVTLSATIDSFASARDPNPIDGMVIYYGIIQNIIEIDYWGCFSVVLFRCDWFHNEVDEYGLTRVYFNKKCSTNDPFVLTSQVHQVFYVEDLIEQNVYYARHKVPVDLYDLEEDNCPNIEESFWRETNDDIGSLEKVLDVDVRWSREDLPIDIIDLSTLAQYSEDVTTETSKEKDDFDDTDWDWMEADD